MQTLVPEVTFKTRVRDESIGGENPFRWQDVSTDDQVTYVMTDSVQHPFLVTA